MIMGDVTIERIFEFYDDITRENVIKLLLRCKKMYEARVDVKKILRLIMAKETLLEKASPILEEKASYKSERDKPIVMEALRMTSRILRELNQFKAEHKIFKGKFIFRKRDYGLQLLEEADYII